MIKKEFEKKKAIELRRQGKTYSEILTAIPVAKSTLSLWLRDVGLARRQQQRITEKKLLSAQRGGDVKRQKRIERQNEIMTTFVKDIGHISSKELFLMGVTLYWAEGSKQKEHNVSQQVCFGNSDPNMIELFLYWLTSLKIRDKDIYFELYIHKDADYRKAVIFWSKVINKPASILKDRVYFKKGNPSSFRKNKGEKYHGLLRVKVLSSTILNRKIEAWIQGIVKSFKR